MSKVTAIRIGKGRKKRVKVSLDDRTAFSLEAEVVIEEGLRVGRELSAGRIEALEQEQKGLYTEMAGPEFYRGTGERIGLAKKRADKLQQGTEQGSHVASPRWHRRRGDGTRKDPSHRGT